MSPVIARENFDDIWPSGGELVVYCPGGSEEGFAAFTGGIQVEKGENIADHICMEGLNVHQLR